MFITAALITLSVIPRTQATVTAGFSPGGTAQELILAFTASARQSADVAAYDFTSRPVALALALTAAVARGVKVRLIADEKKSRDRWSLVSQLACAGVDVALMTVSPRFIPLDSAYEGLVEEKLWQEKRAFIKPLRYDGEEDVFPDFILTDVQGTDALPLEVFGMNSPEYLARKQKKIAHYDREYGAGRWWQWDASSDPEGDAMPAFPAR